MAYTPQYGNWIDWSGVTDGDRWSQGKQGYWAVPTGADYGPPPEAGMVPFFDHTTGRMAGWTTDQSPGGGSGLFGDFGGGSTFRQYLIDPTTGEMTSQNGTVTPSRSGMTEFMSYAMPIAMASGLGYGGMQGAFSGLGGTSAATGAAESMWPGLAGAGGGGVPGGYAGAIGAGAAPSGAALGAGGTLSGGLGGMLGGFGDAGASLAGLTGAPEVSYGPGEAPGAFEGSFGGGGATGSSPFGNVGSTLQKIGGAAGNLLGNTGPNNGLGGLLGGLLGGGLGYLDAKNQPDSLTIKNEIDPRLAQYAYGADGKSGIAGAANNLMQQQLGQPNPLAEAGKQISGMAGQTPNWNQLVTDAKGQWDANPFIKDQQNAITGQMTRNLQENILPGIGSAANMAGGYGGSRQGVAQALSISRMNQDLAPALTGLASNAWESSQNRALNSAQSAGSYGLNNQAQQAGLLGTGANLQMQGPWAPINNATNTMRSLPGNSSTTQPLFNNPIAAGLGGASVGSQIGGGTNWGDVFKGIGGIGDIFKNWGSWN